MDYQYLLTCAVFVMILLWGDMSAMGVDARICDHLIEGIPACCAWITGYVHAKDSMERR